MKRPHPNGQYCNKIQKKQYVDRNASFEKEKNGSQRVECSECKLLRREIAEIRDFVRGHIKSGTNHTCTVKPDEATVGGVGVNARNSYGAGRNGRNVEFRDVASQSEIVGKTEDVLPLERNRDHRDARRGVYRRAPDQNPGENDVRRKPCSYIQPVWKGNEPTKILHQVTERAGSDRTGSSDDPVNTKQSENMVEQSPSCRKTYLAAVLEGSQQMVRDGGVDQRTISRGHQNKDCHLVGARNQNISPQPLSAVLSFFFQLPAADFQSAR